MTSLAFILGIFPLVVASGAGQVARHSLGTAVVCGMVVSTLVNLYLIPVLYVGVETVRERFVPHYDRLVHDRTLQTKTEVVEGMVDAIAHERDRLRAEVAECVRRWLAGVVDDLVAAAYADASPVLPRAF